ncbi:MAG: plasmid replication, integration and excision activator [Streptosporangiaceae bacterium]
MALQGPIPVEFGAVFPDGAYAAGKFEMVRDFDRSQGDRVVQQVDKASGLPLWVIEVIDPQESARQLTVKVKVAAQYQPVLPSPAAGSPFTAIEFDGLVVTPYVDTGRCQGKGKCGARQAYSLKATGVRAPSRGIGRPAPEHKDAA